jgi:hypothetical protein
MTSVHQYRPGVFGGSRNFEIGGPSKTQRNVFLPEYREFRPKAALQHFGPRKSVGRKILSIAPGTKPGPRWCPISLTHTQKQRVHRLRELVIQEEIAEKRCDEWFNQDRPVVPLKMTWRKKLITTKKNINADDILVDRISEISRDAPIDINIDKGG